MARRNRSIIKLCDRRCGGYPRGTDYAPDYETRIFSAITGHVGSLRNFGRY